MLNFFPNFLPEENKFGEDIIWMTSLFELSALSVSLKGFMKIKGCFQVFMKHLTSTANFCIYSPSTLKFNPPPSSRLIVTFRKYKPLIQRFVQQKMRLM